MSLRLPPEADAAAYRGRRAAFREVLFPRQRAEIERYIGFSRTYAHAGRSSAITPSPAE